MSSHSPCLLTCGSHLWKLPAPQGSLTVPCTCLAKQLNLRVPNIIHNVLRCFYKNDRSTPVTLHQMQTLGPGGPFGSTRQDHLFLQLGKLRPSQWPESHRQFSERSETQPHGSYSPSRTREAFPLLQPHFPSLLPDLMTYTFVLGAGKTVAFSESKLLGNMLLRWQNSVLRCFLLPLTNPPTLFCSNDTQVARDSVCFVNHRGICQGERAEAT